MSDLKTKEFFRLERAGRRLYDARLVVGALGSLAVRLGSGAIAVSARSARLGFLNQQDMVVLDSNGLPPEGSRPVNDDVGMLYQVLETCEDSNAVIRINPAFTTALSFGGYRKVEKASEVMEHLGGVAFIPYYRPGTAGLAGAVADAMREARVAVIERQGPVVRGDDVESAVDLAEALEAASKVSFLISGNGDTRGW